MKHLLMMLACFFTLQAAHAQVLVKTKNISRYPFTADSVRLKVPEVFTEIDSVTQKINKKIGEQVYLFDSSFWPDIFKDSSYNRIPDSSHGLHYEVLFNKQKLFIIRIFSDFFFEPHQQNEIFWFNTISGNCYRPIEILSLEGINRLKDSMIKASAAFKKENKKIIRRHYQDFNFENCHQFLESSLIFAEFVPGNNSILFHYQCNMTMSCDLFGPNGVWIIDRNSISDFLIPELANQLK